ncbi:hypothetical protein O5624_02370 [Escherichia coli]|nr:hypothetical protein [Escherichia coli]
MLTAVIAGARIISTSGAILQKFDKAAAQASRDGKPEPEYGGLGFVDNAIPNPDCPKVLR